MKAQMVEYKLLVITKGGYLLGTRSIPSFHPLPSTRNYSKDRGSSGTYSKVRGSSLIFHNCVPSVGESSAYVSSITTFALVSQRRGPHIRSLLRKSFRASCVKVYVFVVMRNLASITSVGINSFTCCLSMKKKYQSGEMGWNLQLYQ